MHAKNFLCIEERKAIQAAVGQFERRTSAELVCAVATESGRYDRSEAIIGLAGSLVTLTAVHWMHGMTVERTGSWTGTSTGLNWQCFAVVIGFIIGNVLASYVHSLRRLVTSQSEMGKEVLRSAWFVFDQHKLARTTGHHGLLIYVSLFEKRVAVLGDEGILSATVGQAFLNHLRDVAVKELRKGNRSGTFLKTIETAVEGLSEALPAGSEAKNELRNDLVLIHPRP